MIIKSHNHTFISQYKCKSLERAIRILVTYICTWDLPLHIHTYGALRCRVYIRTYQANPLCLFYKHMYICKVRTYIKIVVNDELEYDMGTFALYVLCIKLYI